MLAVILVSDLSPSQEWCKRIAQWLECRTRDWKVAGSNPCRSGRRILFSRVDFLCWLLFRYPFHPCVTTVAHKRSRSFCQKCRWQVTAKHTYTLCMWLCMKWHGAWLYGVHRTVAHKRSRSFCQKCWWQVTAKHTYTLRMWLCMKWHGAGLYGVHRTCAETAAVSCGTSHASSVSTPLWWMFKKHTIKS